VLVPSCLLQPSSSQRSVVTQYMVAGQWTLWVLFGSWVGFKGGVGVVRLEGYSSHGPIDKVLSKQHFSTRAMEELTTSSIGMLSSTSCRAWATSKTDS
jgi:hypothetical protein